VYLDTVALVNDQCTCLLKKYALMVPWIQLSYKYQLWRSNCRNCRTQRSRAFLNAFEHTLRATSLTSTMSSLVSKVRAYPYTACRAELPQTDTIGLYHNRNTVLYTLQTLHQSPQHQRAPMVC
jgi:hypothetical protein